MPVTPRHRWKHHTLAEKQAFIAEIERQVKAGRGVRPVARELGIAPGNYYRWLSEGVRPTASPTAAAETVVEEPATMPTPAGVDARERARIIAAVRASLAEGTPVKISAKRQGITEGTFYRWVREAARRPARPPRSLPRRRWLRRRSHRTPRASRRTRSQGRFWSSWLPLTAIRGPVRFC